MTERDGAARQRPRRWDMLALALIAIFVVALASAGLATLVAPTPPANSAQVLVDRADGTATATPLGSAGAVAATSTPPPQPTLIVRHSVRPARILFIGDSLTGGYYASDYAHSFPALVTVALGALDVHPAIYYGHTAANTIAAMNQVPPPSVDVAVVELGINDNDDGNLTLFQHNYADVLARLKRANSAVLLVCLGIWQDASAQPFNNAVRALCQAAGGRYHDLAPLYTIEAYHGPLGRPTWVGPGDWFHPNNAGHAAIAAAVLQTLGVRQ